MSNEFRIIYNELLTNRYMLSILLLNVNSLVDCILAHDKELATIIPKFKKEQLEKFLSKKNLIQFEFFSITQGQYQRLINDFGEWVTVEGCKIIDLHLKTTRKKYKSVYRLLKYTCSKIKAEQDLKEAKKKEQTEIRSIDVEKIDDKEKAIKYIESFPKYMRNLDSKCLYLINKFKLEVI